jgi:hypothetical protein
MCRRAVVLFPVLILALLTGGAGRAEPVRPDRVEQLVRGWLSVNPQPLDERLGSVDRVQSYSVGTDEERDASPSFYIVSLAPSGFVAVSGDDRLEPIIAFVPYGDYIDSVRHPAGALIRHGMTARLAVLDEATARDASLAADLAERFARNQSKWQRLTAGQAFPAPAEDSRSGTFQATISDVRIPPLLTSTWGQGDAPVFLPDGTVEQHHCFNYYTPDHRVCGCVATATAQVVRYHHYPRSGVGTAEMYYEYEDFPFDDTRTGRLRGGDGQGGAYRWDLMRDHKNQMQTEAEREAVGALCWDVGISVHMSYGEDESGAFTEDVVAALRNVFRYSNAVSTGIVTANQIPHSTLMEMPGHQGRGRFRRTLHCL